MKPQEVIDILKIFTTDKFQRCTSSEFDDAIYMAIEALQKQIPKKPILEKTKGIVGVDMWHCPVCKDEIISDWNRDIANPYCHHCGQAINWEGIE